MDLLNGAKFNLLLLVSLDDKIDQIVAQIAMSVEKQNVGLHLLNGFTSSNCSKETLVVNAP